MSLSKTSSIPIKTSNLKAAIRQLDGHSFRVDHHSDHAPHSNAFDINRVADTILGKTPSSENSVSIGETEQEHDSNAHLKQARELVELVKQKEKMLVQQEADHHVNVWNWQQQVAKQQRTFKARQSELDEQEVQLRNLQFELLQLQNELIDSQLSTRDTINQLGTPELQNDALKNLKFELNQRFDHVMITWRQFGSYMQELADSLADDLQPVQIEL